MGRKRKLISTNDSVSKCRKLIDFFQSPNKGSQTESDSNCETLGSELETQIEHETCAQPSSPLLPTLSRKTIVRKFLPSWQHGRPWLRFDAKQLMFCDTCIQGMVSNVFTTGCDTLKSENITKHQNAKGGYSLEPP